MRLPDFCLGGSRNAKFGAGPCLHTAEQDAAATGNSTTFYTFAFSVDLYAVTGLYKPTTHFWNLRWLTGGWTNATCIQYAAYYHLPCRGLTGSPGS